MLSKKPTSCTQKARCSREIVHEPAPADPVIWAMMEDKVEHNEFDSESTHDELDLIDLPAEPGPSHRPGSIALRQGSTI